MAVIEFVDRDESARGKEDLARHEEWLKTQSKDEQQQAMPV